MIIAWIIGVLINIIVIVLLKNTRNLYNEPILRVWLFLLLCLVAIIPIFNILLGIIALIVIIIGIGIDDWYIDLPENKIFQFLNKPIK